MSEWSSLPLETQVQVYSSGGRGDHPGKGPQGAGKESTESGGPVWGGYQLWKPGIWEPSLQPATSRILPDGISRAGTAGKDNNVQAMDVSVNKSKKKRIRRRDSKRKEIGLTILGNNANSILQKC